MLLVSLGDITKENQHERAHRLLALSLGKFGIKYTADDDLAKGKYGKPYLVYFPDLHFSVSHADGIAACIVSCSECGIDCEKIRGFRPNVMKRVFTEAETELVLSAPEKERDTMFFRIWTLKESYIKMLGRGLSFPMKEAEFSFGDNEIVTNLKDCTFRQYIIKGKYVLSVCEEADYIKIPKKRGETAY